jgi:hypothetical protein
LFTKKFHVQDGAKDITTLRPSLQCVGTARRRKTCIDENRAFGGKRPERKTSPDPSPILIRKRRCTYGKMGGKEKFGVERNDASYWRRSSHRKRRTSDTRMLVFLVFWNREQREQRKEDILILPWLFRGTRGEVLILLHDEERLSMARRVWFIYLKRTTG